MDGISITASGIPRTHIWTYASGLSDAEGLVPGNQRFGSSCPFLVKNTMFTPQAPPSFVDDNYTSVNQETPTILLKQPIH